MGLTQQELKRCLGEAVEAAVEGGLLMMECIEKNATLEVEEKSCVTDLVTQYDKKVESMIFRRLRKEFPAFATLGEESDAGKKVGPEPTWIVDPIDGTLSFMHRAPDCCVCIGLAVDRKPVLGVVYAPVTNELYTAIKGEGAYCNGRRIRSSGCTDMKKALVCSHFPSYTRDKEFVKDLFNVWSELMQYPVQGMRATGSCALDMCSVARGRLDAYFECGICTWDVCAASVILTEAGGVTCDVNGGPFDMENRRVLACSTPEIAKSLSHILKKNPSFRPHASKL